MTTMQIAYQTLLETARYHRESVAVQQGQLAETMRHNQISEIFSAEQLAQGWYSADTARMNADTNRMNAEENIRYHDKQITLAYDQLGESSRHNQAMELLGWGELGEKQRHNVAEEGIQWYNAEALAKHYSAQDAAIPSQIALNEANAGLATAKTTTESYQQGYLQASTGLATAKTTTESYQQRYLQGRTVETAANVENLQANTDYYKAQIPNIQAQTSKTKAETANIEARTDYQKMVNFVTPQMLSLDLWGKRADNLLKEADTAKSQAITDYYKEYWDTTSAIANDTNATNAGGNGLKTLGGIFAALVGAGFVGSVGLFGG